MQLQEKALSILFWNWDGPSERSWIEARKLGTLTSILTCHWMQLPLRRRHKLRQSPALWLTAMPRWASAVSCQNSTILVSGGMSVEPGFTMGWFPTASTSTHTWSYLLPISSSTWKQFLLDSSFSLLYKFARAKLVDILQPSQFQQFLEITTDVHCLPSLLTIPDSLTLGYIYWLRCFGCGVTNTCSKHYSLSPPSPVATALIHSPSKLGKEMTKDIHLDHLSGKYILTTVSV